MYFKKLELIGFKSFCDKTTLHFEPGITAVVGPNGCGKSNIFDSIRWVLGEQSVKSLRGSDMQDVIFNGTDIKEPLGMAEVTLTFDNEARFFNVDHPEVAITRRIFRSGESEYLLNKTQVRLKDILDLLMGTGIGAESYSLVAQGKIDLVLSSKPEDRRLVFDEASGITKYKTQKREAARRLEETEQNLLRLNDIIAEVKRQIGSLERQANKARRYKEVFEELKLKELNLALLKKRVFQEQRARITQQLNELEVEEKRLLSNIAEQESILNSRSGELKSLQQNILDVNNQIMNLHNQVSRSKERIGFNQERIIELERNKEYLRSQVLQVQNRLNIDAEKLNKLKEEQENLQHNIAKRQVILKENEDKLNNITVSIKVSLQNIAANKMEILDLFSLLAAANNQISDLSGQEQISLARKKRLEIEKAKNAEEKAATETSLNALSQELESLEKDYHDLETKISGVKQESEAEKLSLSQIDAQMQDLENQKLGLASQKEFLEKLKNKYADISESMDAVIYLDKTPQDKMSGMVIKIKEYLGQEQNKTKLSGEAKPIDLDTNKITDKISLIDCSIESLRQNRSKNEFRIAELVKFLDDNVQGLRNREIALVNKRAAHGAALEQFNKIKEEEELVILELSDTENDLLRWLDKLNEAKLQLTDLEIRHKAKEELIVKEQNNIAASNTLKEQVLVAITQAKTELDALTRRVGADLAGLAMLEENYLKEKESLSGLDRQILENDSRVKDLGIENMDLKERIILDTKEIEVKNLSLKQAEDNYRNSSSGLSDSIKKIDSEKQALEIIKAKLYELQMQDKEIDFKLINLKDRMLQGYKIDLDALQEVPVDLGQDSLAQEIDSLKNKLDSYGTVNLVAIEEYDELKKRYDFLTQQQNDLLTAKDSLHQAILKINRTTKLMFLETFEKVKVEFKNYFRQLFNGGDAQVFLVDEQDPLESGIEIICRPPGKKLQNILLLSGGEKSMSAIALIFAIFKVKPAPFCVLDEIDAALDEANVNRFAGLLQDFLQMSQFIVITHNKRTIVNANVMYGITMQESGVSRIVSVKFSKDKPKEDKISVEAGRLGEEPDTDVALAEPV